MSLVGNIAGKGFLPAPWLTLAHSSVTIGVKPRIYAKWPFFAQHREYGCQETLLNTSKRASHPHSNYDPIPRYRISTSAERKRRMLVSTQLGPDFSKGVHTQLCNRPFLRPTPTPQHESTGALPIGLRPEGDHAPRYRERRFSLG